VICCAGTFDALDAREEEATGGVDVNEAAGDGGGAVEATA